MFKTKYTIINNTYSNNCTPIIDKILIMNFTDTDDNDNDYNKHQYSFQQFYYYHYY